MMTNGQGHENPPEANAAVTEDLALDWLVRREREGWRESDQVALDAWLSESWANTVAYWRLDAAWNRANRLRAARTFGGAEKMQSTKRRQHLLRIAAGIGIVSIVGLTNLALTRADGPNQKLYSTAVGGRKTLALIDGSSIELNTDTVIRVSSDGHQRKIDIDKGEAYFQVKHDAVHPFVVNAGWARIVDLGTKFSVRRDAGELRVALVEGRAQITIANAGTQIGSALLVPGDIAIATPTSFSVMKKPSPKLRDVLGWRQGLLIFDNVPLSEVASEFNRYNKTKLVVASDATGAVPVGGTFAAQDVEAFVRVAKGVLGLRVQNHGKEIVVSQ